MSYLILQILLWLVSAALLGLSFGWFLGRRGSDAAVEEERSRLGVRIGEWESRHREALEVADAGRARIAVLENELDALRAELHARAERLIELEGPRRYGPADVDERVAKRPVAFAEVPPQARQARK